MLSASAFKKPILVGLYWTPATWLLCLLIFHSRLWNFDLQIKHKIYFPLVKMGSNSLRQFSPRNILLFNDSILLIKFIELYILITYKFNHQKKGLILYIFDLNGQFWTTVIYFCKKKNPDVCICAPLRTLSKSDHFNDDYIFMAVSVEKQNKMLKENLRHHWKVKKTDE